MYQQSIIRSYGHNEHVVHFGVGFGDVGRVHQLSVSCEIWLTSKLSRCCRTDIGVSRNTAPRRNTRLGFNWISRKCGGNVEEMLNTSNGANLRRDKTSSYPLFVSPSSAVHAVYAVCVVRCFLTVIGLQLNKQVTLNTSVTNSSRASTRFISLINCG